MRLMSTKQNATYIDTIDRAKHTEETVPNDHDGKPRTELIGTPNDAGEPVPGHTVWYFRGLTSAEEGTLTDAMFDFGKTSVTGADGNNAKVDVGMSISPSTNRRSRVRLALVGWENLYGEETDGDGNPLPIEYKAEPFDLLGQRFTGAPGAVLDMIPQAVLTRMDRFVKGLSSVEPGTGER